MPTYECHNPACRRPVKHADAFLRSVLFERVAFCSLGCVTMFDQFDKMVRNGGVAGLERAIPAQRKAMDAAVVNERMVR
jgi:hypothetical protein